MLGLIKTQTINLDKQFNKNIETVNKSEKNLDNLLFKQKLEKKDMLVFSNDKSNFCNDCKSFGNLTKNNISILEQRYQSNHCKLNNNLSENNKSNFPKLESSLNTICNVSEFDFRESFTKKKLNELDVKLYTSENISKTLKHDSFSCSENFSNSSLSTIEDEKKDIPFLLSKNSLTKNLPIDLFKENNNNENYVPTTIYIASKIEKPSITMMHATSIIVKSARFSKRTHKQDSLIKLSDYQPFILNESYNDSKCFTKEQNDVTSNNLFNLKKEDNKTIDFLPFSDNLIDFSTNTSQQLYDTIDLNLDINNSMEDNDNLELIKQDLINKQNICKTSLSKSFDTIQSLQNSLPNIKEITDDYIQTDKNKNLSILLGCPKTSIQRRRSSSAMFFIKKPKSFDSLNFRKNSLLNFKKQNKQDNSFEFLTNKIDQIKSTAPTSISYIKSFFKQNSLLSNEKNNEKIIYHTKNFLQYNYNNIKNIKNQSELDSNDKNFNNKKSYLFNYKTKSNFYVNHDDLKKDVINVKLAREESFFSENDDLTLFNDSNGK